MGSKIVAVLLTLIGLIPVVIERDATLLVLVELFAISLFFGKKSGLIL